MSGASELVVHVGYHKTGTTFLQRRVFGDRSLGFLAEPRGQSDLATQEFLTRDPLAFDAEASRRVFEPLLTEASSSGLVPVISQERLSANPRSGQYMFPLAFAQMLETFGRFRVLVTIREQRGMLLSLYRQLLRSGQPLTLTEAIGTGNEPPGWSSPIRPEYLRYDLLVSHVMERVGESSVLVLPMEWLREDPAAYMRRLFAFCGVPEDGAPVMESENEGLGALTATVLRRFSWFGRPNPISPRASGAMRLKRAIGYRLDRALPRSWSRGVEQRWREEIRQRVAGMYGESNRRLASLTGLDLARYGYDM
ncbi:MAG: sulfotransferase family protein [Phycisphaerales bacterium]